MNVKELIEKYEYLNHNYFRRVDTSEVLRDLKQLDEPQKVVVPQFVADWYENHKDDLEYDIWEYILRWGKQQKSEFYEWMNHANNKPLQTLANMHQFGYTVEKEKRYRVVMPNVSSTGGVLTRIKHDDSWIWIDTLGTIVEGRTHTRKELEEAGFGWIFDCEGVEVEEVTE
jgi:hypothetical protein